MGRDRAIQDPRRRLERDIVDDPVAREKLELEARAARNAAESEVTVVGSAFLRDAQECDSIAKLSRYGTSAQRNLHRALNQLERLQAARDGKPHAAPIAVDVDQSVSKTQRNSVHRSHKTKKTRKSRTATKRNMRLLKAESV